MERCGMRRVRPAIKRKRVRFEVDDVFVCVSRKADEEVEALCGGYMWSKGRCCGGVVLQWNVNQSIGAEEAASSSTCLSHTWLRLDWVSAAGMLRSGRQSHVQYHGILSSQ
jgi:hypothetical protein